MNDFKSLIEKLRTNDEEFGHLNGKVFLDHAANTIYMKSVIHEYSKKLTENLFSNPHSNSESGIYTQNFVNQTRQNVLDMFKANDYDLVFVSNATHGLKLLVELFRFDGEHQDELRSSFAYLNDNHTSVIGMRELVWSNSSSCDVYCVYEKDDELTAEIVPQNSFSFKTIKNGIGNLFVYPAQSNFNGRKYPLDWIREIQSDGDAKFKKMNKTSNNWFVCLDAASFVCTSVLDLSSSNKPDFVPISFYKIFGFPTGLGALLIRKSERMKNCLKKKYFGGGTISMALVDKSIVEFRTGDDYHNFLEDGTISYLDIIGLNVAMNRFKNVLTNNYMSLIETYLTGLTNFCLQKLNELKHYNEEKLVVIYRNAGDYGSILAFNLMDSKKIFISYILVNKLAQEFGIHLRVGCFCNIGACKMHLKSLNILENFQLFGHKCGDHIDIINGEPTGACRVSFSYCSTYEDVLKFVDFLQINFIETRKSLSINNDNSLTHAGHCNEKQYFKLVHLFIYPIKSCAGFEIIDKSWPISQLTNSLLYDRNWIIIDCNQIPLTQKRLPTLVNLHANIDLKNNTLKLMYNDSSFCLDLEAMDKSAVESNGVQVCIKKINGFDCGDEVAKWLKEKMNLNFDCRLIKLGKDSCVKETENKTFSNQADFLLISINSVRKLRAHLLKSFDIQINENRLFYNIDRQLMLQFRANFVVEILTGVQEKSNEEFWKFIKIGESLNFEIISLCSRCQMININQSDVNNNQEILKHLLKELNNFKENSKFGVYLKNNQVTKVQEDLVVGMIGTAF